jgi:hypothetical protein
MAVLTFNLISQGAQVGDGPKSDVRWNSTEVYQRISGQWKIIHSHWSYTKPELEEEARGVDHHKQRKCFTAMSGSKLATTEDFADIGL